MVFSLVDAAQYFSLKETYDSPNVTDLPTTTTGVAGKDGKLKMVNNRYKGPPQMPGFYSAIDAVIAAQDWKKVQ